MNRKIIALSLLTMATSLFATEMSIDAKAGYNFNTLNRKDNKTSFEPTLPLVFGLKFSPTDINLTGELNIENKEIDGLFKKDGVVENFAIDGKVKYISDKLYKGLKIGVNLDLIAAKGNKFPSNESGDLAIEFGTHYELGKVDLGALLLYKSNQVMEPKLAGLTTVFSGYDTTAKLSAGYNLETLHKYQTVFAKDGSDLKNEYKEDGKGYAYYNGKDSKINLVPIYVGLEVENKVKPLDRLSLTTTAELEMNLTKFNGNLRLYEIKDNKLSKIFLNNQQSEREQRDVAKNTIFNKNGAEEVSAKKELTNLDDLSLSASVKLAADYTILDNLSLSVSDKIKFTKETLKYVEKDITSTSDSTSSSTSAPATGTEEATTSTPTTDVAKSDTPQKDNLIISNELKANLKYEHEFYQVDGLSLEVNGGFGLVSEVNVKGEKDFSIDKVLEAGKVSGKTSKSAHDLNVNVEGIVKYQVFETLTVNGGLGFEVMTSIDGKKDSKPEFLYRGISPKVMVGATYSW